MAYRRHSVCTVANVPSPGADHTLRPALSHSVRTTELDSQGGTHRKTRDFSPWSWRTLRRKEKQACEAQGLSLQACAPTLLELSLKGTDGSAAGPGLALPAVPPAVQPELYSKDQMLKLLLLEQLLGTLAPRDPGPLAGAAARQSRGSCYLGRQASLGARLASG